jgi:hypothetical protein
MVEEIQEAIKGIINETEISIILDTYDDIFSDFDPRPYNERALSEDFLAEAKRAARDKDENLELRFLIPKDTRNIAQETVIKNRLRRHFRKHYINVRDALIAYKNQAILLIIIGIAIGLVEAIALSAPTTFDIGSLLTDVIGIVLTPASWFSIWTGFEHLIYKPKEEVEEGDFYRKMEKIKISFSSY